MSLQRELKGLKCSLLLCFLIQEVLLRWNKITLRRFYLFVFQFRCDRGKVLSWITLVKTSHSAHILWALPHVLDSFSCRCTLLWSFSIVTIDSYFANWISVETVFNEFIAVMHVRNCAVWILSIMCHVFLTTSWSTLGSFLCLISL